MWSGFVLGSAKKRFWFFYHDGQFIDKIMNKKGFAATIVSRTIEQEIVWPFLKEQSANTPVKMSLETMALFDPNQKPDYSEADWKKLHKIIRKKFNRSYAASNVLEARIKWYERHKNYNSSTKLILQKFEKAPPDITNLNTSGMINDLGWNTFLQVTDKNLLNGATYWVDKMVRYWGDTAIGYAMLDTYANLLYKTGRKEDAIRWQEKAMIIAEKYPDSKPLGAKYRTVIEKMKKGEPTYLEQGAVWTKIPSK